MAGLVSYGGDPRVVATRTEIDRVSGELGVVAQRGATALLDVFHDPIHRLQFDVHVPELELRLAKLRLALGSAADSYFTTEATVAMRLTHIGHFVRDHPWLLNLMPQGVREKVIGGGLVAAGASLFAPGTIGANSVRFIASTQDIGARVDAVQAKGLLHDTKVVIRSKEVSAGGVGVNSLRGIADRVKQTQELGSSIRVERYRSASGSEIFVLYVPGTQTGYKNPFDFTSDAQLAADPDHSQLGEAVRQALSQAGVTKSSQLVVAGYSLGGMLASSLAADTEYNVTGFVSLGAPIATAQIGSDVNVLAIEHSNDPVPGATGETNPLAENWVTASRKVQLAPGEIVMHAHELDEYRQSARMADTSHELGLVRVREAILSPLRDSKLVETTSFELRRG